MMFSTTGVRGATIHATDGTIGTVDDLYFDDATWHIRYVVVDTGGWLTARKVLLVPGALGEYNAERRDFSSTLTREQVRSSPDIDTEKPVSRQQETTLHDYYGWAPYWGQGLIPGLPSGVEPGAARGGASAVAPARGEAAPEVRPRIEAESGDPNLRSTRAVAGHGIHATDGNIGHVEDFLVDDTTWVIRYMIVDTRNWLPGKKVLISPQWIEKVNWPERSVSIDLTRAQVQNSPEFDPRMPIDRDYEDRLFRAYGRVPYW